MDYGDIYRKLHEQVANVLALGALGAELKLLQTGTDGDARVRTALGKTVAQLVPLDDLKALEPGQIAALLGQLSYAVQESFDLIREPERAPGWSYTDPKILQERGRGSRGAALLYRKMAETRPVLKAILEKEDCCFLDVGVGVAWLSIQAAEIWPKMRIVGLDILEPALRLAEQNIMENGLQNRITLRRQSVTDLADEAAFNLAWIPSMFMPKQVVEEAIPRLHRALKPGGMLIFALFAPAPGVHGKTVTDLLTVRSGGHAWAVSDIEAMLTTAGFRDLEFVNTGSTANMMLARRQ